jgi:hypothetical protein
MWPRSLPFGACGNSKQQQQQQQQQQQPVGGAAPLNCFTGDFAGRGAIELSWIFFVSESVWPADWAQRQRQQQQQQQQQGAAAAAR